MLRSIVKLLVLVILLLPVFGLLSGCSGGGGGGVGTGTIPAAPTGLTVTVSNNQVVLHWSAAANAATYRVYYEVSPGLTKTTGSAPLIQLAWRTNATIKIHKTV